MVTEQFAENADKKFREMFPEINNCVKEEVLITAWTDFPALMIKKHCLSKQRVKEAIIKINGIHSNLLKELGLGDE